MLPNGLPCYPLFINILDLANQKKLHNYVATAINELIKSAQQESQ